MKINGIYAMIQAVIHLKDQIVPVQVRMFYFSFKNDIVEIIKSIY